jgi:cytochrome c oxidase subunit 4
MTDAAHGHDLGHDAHGDDHSHAGIHDPNDHHSPEAIRKELKVYWMVFGCLAVLTIITVGLRYLDMPIHWAIAVALAVALVKGSLVAAFFMHLLSEKKLVYAVLIITVFFFGVLLWGPWHHGYDIMK